MYVLIGIITIIVLLFLYMGYLHNKYAFETIEKEEKKIASKIYENTFNDFIKKYESIAENILLDNNVLQALKNSDRKALLDITLPIYKNLNKENPFLQVMHFHTKDTVSFLRLHKPEKFGDDLSSIRHMINKVNSTHKKQIGIEVGRYGIYSRVALPIINKKNEFLGVLEFGININYILDVFGKKYDFHPILLIEKKLFTIIYKGYEGVAYSSYSDGYYAIDSQSENEREKSCNNSITFKVTDLKSATNDNIGQILFTKDMTLYMNLKNTTRNLSIISALIMVFIALYIIRIILKRHIHVINEYESRLNIKHRSLLKLSNTDHLTKINNRQAIERYLSKELKRAKRHNVQLSLLMIDIDNFKSINDTFGHNTGDHVIKNIAKIISTTIRDTDYCGRWGGEEFIILCPETSSTNAIVLAEKIREAVHAFNFKIGRDLTCSIGVCEYAEGYDAEMLVGNADSALYSAKNSGKNRVIVYQTP
ncbi:diguanylate cyclase [Sulfurimonas aquatica]|uniref:diguanylate cyclase n=2 Tax=Sulfurimonas aquatica TaxID=2672570 RepID=A0A975B2W1_9BACT|nr:diguanylate cyclase [Sulfurimonas aquatica]